MRAAPHAAALLALVGGCATEVIELLPDAASPPDARADIAAPGEAPPVDTAAPPDVTADAPAPDLTPDVAPACVCRFNSCRSRLECEQFIGPGSDCTQGTLCSGAAGSCTKPSDCGADPSVWLCTQGPDSIALCP